MIDLVNDYIHTQQALGNWPDHSFFANGDEALLALVDTYDFIHNHEPEEDWDH